MVIVVVTVYCYSLAKELFWNYYTPMVTKHTIIDSALSHQKMLLQNPDMEAPNDVLEQLESRDIRYYGFDGNIHQGQIVMHREAIADVVLFFEQALLLCFPITSVIPIADTKYMWNDEVSCDDNNSSGYNFRYIAGTTRMSNHARGLAFDINPLQNPYIKYDEHAHELWRAPKRATYDESLSGTLTALHPLVILLQSKGWIWGGAWKKEEGVVDYQHFEKKI